MAFEIKVKDLIKDLKEKGLIRIVPEKDFDFKEEHPLHKYLVREGITN